MYEHLRGRLVAKSPSSAAIECAGVAYLLRIPLSTFERLPAVGAECTLLAHLHVGQDAWALYGFTTAEERSAFEKMLGITGIGPKLALTVLSGMRPAELARAVADGDAATLRRIKGIGEKTASRILLELKGVLDELLAAPGRAAGVPPPSAADAVSALVNLGYQRRPAEEAVLRAAAELGPDAPAGDLIRAVLARGV
jgi:Holliday junction DNA helicase RuvA